AGGGATDVYIQNSKTSATSLKVTKITFTVNIPTLPEEEEAQTDTATVTTMQEVITALGSRTKVTVFFKNLKPITKVSNSIFYSDYMPDGITDLNMGGYTLPADFDCYGTYAKNSNDKYVFTVDTIIDIYAFANTYLLKDYYEKNKADENILSELNITEPVVVTAVEGNNVFVQYSYARISDNLFNDHLVINGEHSLKVGDKIASFTAKYNKSTSLTLDEENTVLVRNAYFSVEASSLGATTAGNTIKYKALSSISNITSQAGVAAQLPSGGIIVKEGTKYFYTIGTESLQLRPATGVEIESFVGKEMNLSIKGIVDYCNTAEQANAFIVNSIKEINTNYETISQWLRAAVEGEGEGSLKLPVVVTHSEYRNYKQYIFIGDETGGLCLISNDKIDSIKTGHVLTGIAGKLDFSDTKKTPQLSVPSNIQVVDSNKTVEPVEVTIAELLAEENNAINNGKPAIKYANRLVKIRQAKRSASWLKNNARLYGLIQNNGEKQDTLTYASNTLNAYHSTFSTEIPMCVTGIVDFRCINASNLYSIYPRSAEDVKYDFAEPVITPTPGTYYTEELELAITCEDPAMTAIYYSFDLETDPTIDGELYEGPITITNDTTIWFAAEYGDRIGELFQASYKLREATVTATWSIEEGATIESFESVTITFAGVDSVGRKLDGVEVQKAVAQASATNVLFYSVAEDGTRTPVAGGNGLMYAKTEGLSIVYSLANKGYDLVDNKFMPKGNYCIVIDAGDVLFTPNRTSPLPKVFNDKEYVLNFTIENDYTEPVKLVEVDAAFTANPADNSTVNSLSTIVLTFTDKTPMAIGELGETPRPDVWPFLNQVMAGGNDDELGGAIGGMPQAVAPMHCELTEGTTSVQFSIASELIEGVTEITTEGTYTFTIPAGVIKFSETEINKAITLNYTVKSTGTDVDYTTIANIYTVGGMIMAEGEIQIFTVTGQNVTDMNGNLQNGVYVVKSANATTKVIIK
ncbi:MAG: chitobiase/beta-hexosaminidase C-terminal domain-containing protein, partial [Paludibacteraceae bacterium]|nr:chitobiase/beta-hexosaminidase C-terminal domain-containing protein [Paludibacteraceae bacterium]